jgi:uncharacterized protein (TIGR01627 family)
MQHYNKLLNELIDNVKKGQMEKHEYEYISDFLGDVNLLVFGTGYDTKFWRYCNKGTNCFLEHDKNWILEEENDIFLVEYSSRICDYKKLLDEYDQKNYINLEIELPKKVKETAFDVILVDAPPGNKQNSIGRMQSIYTAKKLANENTDIFVHDCDREVEDAYTQKMFTIVKQLKKLRHCKI